MSFRELIEELKKLNKHLDNMRDIFYGASLDRLLPELIAALIDLSKEVKRLNHNVELLLKRIDIVKEILRMRGRPRV